MKNEKTIQLKIQYLISEEFKRLKVDKITPWALLYTGKMPIITDFYGKSICYKGVEFEGSPRIVFWDRLAEPFIKDIIVRSIELVIRLSRENSVNVKKALVDAKKELLAGIKSTYLEMQNIDLRLRKGGSHSRGNKQDISNKVKEMEQFLESHINEAMLIGSGAFSINKLYQDHPFWFWAIGIIIAVIIAILTI